MKKAKLYTLLALLAVSILPLVISLVRANPPGITIKSCDINNVQTEVWDVGDAMCITGSGFAPNTNYAIYVVNNVDWTDGLPIPTRIDGTATTLPTDSSGSFTVFVVWANAQASYTDIIIDMNGNGVYDENVDVLEENHAVGNPFAVPEYAIGGLIAVIACFAALIVFKTGGKLKQLNRQTTVGLGVKK
jgi:hypothetical protein